MLCNQPQQHTFCGLPEATCKSLVTLFSINNADTLAQTTQKLLTPMVTKQHNKSMCSCLDEGSAPCRDSPKTAQVVIGLLKLTLKTQAQVLTDLLWLVTACVSLDQSSASFKKKNSEIHIISRSLCHVRTGRRHLERHWLYLSDVWDKGKETFSPFKSELSARRKSMWRREEARVWSYFFVDRGVLRTSQELNRIININIIQGVGVQIKESSETKYDRIFTIRRVQEAAKRSVSELGRLSIIFQYY